VNNFINKYPNSIMSEDNSSGNNEPEIVFRSVPARVVAGDKHELRILTTRGGKPSDEVVKLQASAGKFTSGGKFREGWAVTGADGRATVTYNAPNRSHLDGAKKVKMKAEISATTVRDSTTQTTVVQDPIEAVLKVGEYNLKPGGSTDVVVRATRGDNPIPGVPLTLVLNPEDQPDKWSEGSGSLEDTDLMTGDDGTASTKYIAPQEPTHDAIDVRSRSDEHFVEGYPHGISVEDDGPPAKVSYRFPGEPPNPGDTIKVIFGVTVRGAPLPSAPLNLKLEKPAAGDHPHDDSPRGKLSKNQVVTGPDGKATVRYYAPDVPTTSGLIVDVNRPGGGMGYHAIVVEE
jgi:hypothetical protein